MYKFYQCLCLDLNPLNIHLLNASNYSFCILQGFIYTSNVSHNHLFHNLTGLYPYSFPVQVWLSHYQILLVAEVFNNIND